MPAPLHCARVAEPPKEPANWVSGLLEQTVWFGPAFTVAAWLIVIVIVELTDPGASVVKVSVAEPRRYLDSVGV